MFQWASSGHERTLNQRIRPGLLIIINKFRGADPQWLDVDFATKRLLSTFQLSGAFSDLRKRWAMQGKTISTAEDLILCYYDSFRVICVPDLTDPKSANLIADQYRTLYLEITKSSAKLREKRIRVGMNLDVQSFSTYVEHAFQRLTKDLAAPIDFYYLSSKDPVIPTRFSEHMTAVIVKLLHHGGYQKSDEIGHEQQLMAKLTPYLASCIAIQMAETDPKGASNTFPRAINVH